MLDKHYIHSFIDILTSVCRTNYQTEAVYLTLDDLLQFPFFNLCQGGYGNNNGRKEEKKHTCTVQENLSLVLLRNLFKKFWNEKEICHSAWTFKEVIDSNTNHWTGRLILQIKLPYKFSKWNVSAYITCMIKQPKQKFEIKLIGLWT